MTPKEKAKALQETFGDKAALVVEEILIAMPTYPSGGFIDLEDRRQVADIYWETVQNEIES